MDKIKIAVSACLMGEKVRHDGSHRHDSFLTQTLSRFCELIPICPEVEAELGLPREAMHLESEGKEIRLIGSKSGRDLSSQLIKLTNKRMKFLAQEKIMGYIFKKRSPSCGISGIAVIDGQTKKLAHMGPGIYAQEFMINFPKIPVIDDGRLHNPELREAFFEKVFMLHKWQSTLRAKKMADLVSFHSWHKMTLMAHSPTIMREMGKLIGNQSNLKADEVFTNYQILLDKNLNQAKTTKKNVDVLMHLFGHFKKEIDQEEKQEFLEILEHYRQGNYPILIPITLLNHFAKKYKNKYVGEQHFLCPHPVELRLRNLL